MKNVMSKALATVAIAAFCISTANAATQTLNFAGNTTGTLTDATNYFGLGTTVGAGQTFQFNVTYDESIIVPTTGQIGPLSSNGFIFVQSKASQSPGPQYLTSMELILGGTALSIDPSQFTQHNTNTLLSRSNLSRRYDCGPSFPSLSCVASSSDLTQRIAITASNSGGSSLSLNFFSEFRFFDSGIPNTQPQIFNQLTGSLSLILLATDGTTLANISALNAFDAAENVPIPAALPLLAAGLATLVGVSRIRRRRLS